MDSLETCELVLFIVYERTSNRRLTWDFFGIYVFRTDCIRVMMYFDVPDLRLSSKWTVTKSHIRTGR